MSSIVVEFFGIARHRALVPLAELPVDSPITIAEVLQKLAEQIPSLVPDCIADGQLSKYCAANVNGDSFVTDSSISLQPSDRLLILSADAGG
ncbi:MAG: MoaD/ThiS family protein [Planctomycetales bacterium]|nr:MoaD/ThiS family protein [Planctomycetales bacterium]